MTDIVHDLAFWRGGAVLKQGLKLELWAQRGGQSKALYLAKTAHKHINLAVNTRTNSTVCNTEYYPINLSRTQFFTVALQGKTPIKSNLFDATLRTTKKH